MNHVLNIREPLQVSKVGKGCREENGGKRSLLYLALLSPTKVRQVHVHRDQGVLGLFHS